MTTNSNLDRRKNTNIPMKSIELPLDFVKMVREVLEGHFGDGLKAMEKEGLCKEPGFLVTGAIWPDEIILSASLISEGTPQATTVHASVDFDPKASSPTLQDQLNLCVDGIGSGFQNLFGDLEVERLEKIAHGSLATTDIGGVAAAFAFLDAFLLLLDKKACYLKRFDIKFRLF
jgi:hypothetical protein